MGSARHKPNSPPYDSLIQRVQGVDKVAALRKNEEFVFSGCRFSCDAMHHGQKICKEAG